jgi:hypothetical protein
VLLLLNVKQHDDCMNFFLVFYLIVITNEPLELGF